MVLQRGRREDVRVYCEHTKEYILARNVLFRKSGSSADVQRAYYPIPHRTPIRTIYGHVETCYVLTSTKPPSVERDEDSDSDSDSEDDDTTKMMFRMTTERVAVKVNYGNIMNRKIGRLVENPLHEIAAMQLIGNDHPNVMGILEYLVVGEDLNVVMPYAASGDMFDRMQNKGKGFTEGEARYWFRQLIDGIQYLHRKGVCHRDLSLENIMIDHKKLIIIDMGMAIRIPYTKRPDNPNPNQPGDTEKNRMLIQPQGTCGKLAYMSPEIFENREAFDGPAVDIWTAGAILFCLVTGSRCYSRPHDSDKQFWWLTNDLSQLIDDWGMEVSKECRDLLQNMLSVDPRMRHTLEEVLNHPWLKDGKDEIPSAVATTE